jgi:hypothetical protein
LHLRIGQLELLAPADSALLAFELSLTHWSYLYLPWVLPFVLLALFLPREPPPVGEVRTEQVEVDVPELARV